MGSKTHIAIWTRRPMKTTTTEERLKGPDVEWCRPFFENWNNCAPSFTLFSLCAIFWRWSCASFLRTDHHWKALLCANEKRITLETVMHFSAQLCCTAAAMVKNSKLQPSHVCARDSHALFDDDHRKLLRASLNNTKNLLHSTELNVVPISRHTGAVESA